MIKLLVFPKASNPYQSLLYTPIRDKVSVTYGKPSSCMYPIELLIARIKGTRVIHLHWLYWLTVPVHKTNLRLLLSSLNIHIFISVCKLLKMRIIWTVHNILPHEQQTPDDLKTIKYLSKSVDLAIVHSSETIRDMDKLSLQTTNTKIIPIGSYENVYPDTISYSSARKKLKIKDDEFVILFFGVIRPYRGLDDLLRVLKDVNNQKIRLIIAGFSSDNSLTKQIIEQSEGLNVDFYNMFIPEEDVALYFRACNVVCLPFKKITTSSSVLLGMAFSKTVIAPRLGALTDIPTNAALFYDPTQRNGLLDTVKRAVKDPATLKNIGINGNIYSKSLSWDHIASETNEAYKQVLSDA